MLYDQSVSDGLSALNVNCIHTFFAAGRFEGNYVTFTDFVHEAANVHENFLPGGAVDDEAKTFGFVEELYGSFVHCKKFKKEKIDAIGHKPRQR